MSKFKICPVCNAKNLPFVLECSECGNDLLGVRIVDESFITVQTDNKEEDNRHDELMNLVKLCDCGAENEVSARKCSVCGEDISDIIPTPKRIETQKTTYSFISDDSKAILRLPCPCSKIIGRENDLSEYLRTKPYVSRKHAKLTVTTEGLFIENLSMANGTYVNNEKLDNNVAYKLCAGDKVGLGGNENQHGKQEAAAYFEIKVE